LFCRTPINVARGVTQKQQIDTAVSRRALKFHEVTCSTATVLILSLDL